MSNTARLKILLNKISEIQKPFPNMLSLQAVNSISNSRSCPWSSKFSLLFLIFLLCLLFLPKSMTIFPGSRLETWRRSLFLLLPCPLHLINHQSVAISPRVYIHVSFSSQKSFLFTAKLQDCAGLPHPGNPDPPSFNFVCVCFPTFSLFWITCTILTNAGQVFWRLSLSVGLSDIFLTFRLR